MCWHINLVTNELKVTKKMALDILSTDCEISCLIRDYDMDAPVEGFLNRLVYQDKFLFDSDHMEHMDFLENDEKIVEILKKHKAKGDIVFCSHDGDNRGQAWCHRFDGQGGYELLTSTTKKMSFVTKPAKKLKK